MRYNEDYAIRKNEDKFVLINIANNRVIDINGTTYEILRHIKSGYENEEIAQKLFEIYDADLDVIRTDVDNIIKALKEVGVILD